MAFTITAEFPLGTYRGHEADRSVDRFPSVARLHAALLCAAGFGPDAHQVGGDDLWEPNEPGLVALRWLEEHPPDAVSVPPLQVNSGSAVAYRDDGTIKRTKKTAAIKKPDKPVGASVAVGGSFRWTWTSPPPDEVAAVLTALCPDVPYLGTTESPVRLSADGDQEPETTHVLDPDAGFFDARGHAVSLPAAGRTNELTAAHHDARGTAPTSAKDRAGSDEVSFAPPLPRVAVHAGQYVPRGARWVETPWDVVLLRTLNVRVPDEDKVRWAVAAHRALIAVIDEGAPPLLTGAYPPGMRRPANRIAIHILDAGLPTDHAGHRTSTLAVLLPSGAAPEEVALIRLALRTLQTLHPRQPRERYGNQSRSARFTSSVEEVAGARFWREPEPGTVRLWETCPVAVPDTRGDGPAWTFVHAALLSLGFVWLDSSLLPRVEGRGGARDRNLVGAVCDAGAAAVQVQPLRTGRPTDYVHRVNEHAVVRPYRALLSLGALGDAHGVQAIGQSRHLGGGLLVPRDIPEGTPLDQITLS